MELLRGIHNINTQHKGCVLSVGVGFNMSDGIHLRFPVPFALQKVVN